MIAPKVRAVFAQRDKAESQRRAVQRLAAGADALDLSVGSQRKAGPGVMAWIVAASRAPRATPRRASGACSTASSLL